MNSSQHFDILIAGAGPAGCTLAIRLAGSGYSVGLIEKDLLPGSKICGDALSGQVVNILNRLPAGICQRFMEEVPKIPSGGILFTAPSLRQAAIPFYDAGGYVCRRRDFDQFLREEAEKGDGITQICGVAITDVRESGGRWIVRTDSGEFSARLLAAADGVHSLIRRKLFPGTEKQMTYCLGIRGYFKGVGEFHPGNFIELHFLKETLPGYLWIFPGPDGTANVGLGILQSQVRRNKLVLSEIFETIVTKYPFLARRFRQATRQGKFGAHPLPLATSIRTISRERCILLGDAAGLVDPFTGEGIGFAMASAETAARVLLNSGRRDFQGFSGAYQDAIRKRMQKEFTISKWMQRLARVPGMINLVIGKASSHEHFRNLLSEMYVNEKNRSLLTRPDFYLKILTRY